MEDRRFDELAKHLWSGATRRKLIRGTAGTALAVVLGRLGVGDTLAKPGQKGGGKGSGKGGGKPDHGSSTGGGVSPAHCAPNQAVCKPARKLGTKHLHKCKQCCSGYSIRVRGGNRRCSCRPDNFTCDPQNPSQCCSGRCNGGKCGQGGGGPQCLAVDQVEGDVTRRPDGALRLHAENPSTYGAFSFVTPLNKTFSQITDMETAFDFSEGTCGAGTPRFVVVFNDTSLPYLAAQIPCSGPTPSGSSGNLIGNNTPGVWFTLCNPPATGGNCTQPHPEVDTYAEALAVFGADEINYIFFVADPSNGTQTVTVTPCVQIA